MKRYLFLGLLILSLFVTAIAIAQEIGVRKKDHDHRIMEK